MTKPSKKPKKRKDPVAPPDGGRMPRPLWDGECPAGAKCKEPSCMEHGVAPCGEDCTDVDCELHADADVDE